jgi:hypothetical protein
MAATKMPFEEAALVAGKEKNLSNFIFLNIYEPTLNVPRPVNKIHTKNLDNY